MNHTKDYTNLQELINCKLLEIIKNLDEIYDTLEIDFDADEYGVNEAVYKKAIDDASTIHRTLECIESLAYERIL